MRFLLFPFVFLISCHSSPVKTTESLILKDIEQHLIPSAMVQKSIVSNGKMEERTDTIHDWKKEFNLFLKYIPNQHVVESDYQVTEIQNSGLILKKYITREKHPLKELEITFDSTGQAQYYYAHVVVSNNLNYADYHLYWDVEKLNYRMMVKEGVAHSREVRYELVGQVLN